MIQEKKMSFPTTLRQETTSTESKETLTPMEVQSNENTLVDDDGSVEEITDLNFETARQKALRRRSVCRRNSETYNNDFHRSQTSLNAMTRRQVSLTQSEPDSGNEQGNTTKIHFISHGYV